MPRLRGRATLPALDASRLDLNGAPVAEAAREALAAGAEMVRAWRELEPIVRQLTTRVKAQVEADEFEGYEAAKLLHLAAGVVQKVGIASQGILRISDQQHRLALLLSGGAQRPAAKDLTEKQMANIVIETVKRMAKERGSCPICTKTITAEP